MNTKVVDNFLSFPESTRIQKSEFVWWRYRQNTELDRDKTDLDVMTGRKRTRYLDAKLNLRTRPKPATRLELGHKLNNTNSEIESAKAKRGDRTRYDE